MKPLPSDVHIDAALSNLSVKYSNSEFIGEQLMPALPVDKDSNKYFIYGKENLRTYKTTRAPGTRATSVDWSVSSDSFACEEHALEHPIPDETRNNADAPLQIESDSVEMLTDMIMLDQEVRVATLALTSGSFASGHTKALAGGDRWDDYTGSDPLKAVSTARSLIHSKIMRVPNTLVLGRQVYEALRNHPEIVGRMSDNASKVVTKEFLAMIFEVERVLVGGAMKITSREGASTEVSSYVWGKNAILAYVGTPGIKTITWGQTFRRSGYRQTEKWREQPIKSDIVKVADKTDEKIVATGAAYLFTTAIS